MSPPEPKATGDGRPRRRTVVAALLVAALALVGAGGIGFAAGRVLSSDDGTVRCASWDVRRCMPALDLDEVLATLTERGFECEHHTCRLAEYWATITAVKGQVHSISASVPVLPDLPLTAYQEAFLSWVAALPFAGQPASAGAARTWLREQVAGSTGSEVNIDGYGYLLRDGGSGRTLVLEIDAGVGGWFR